MKGLVFDIKEFALHDGDGLRTTVFLKGCPLRCIWCHNPEGLSPAPELSVKKSCTDCGLCRRQCEHEECRAFGRCLHICPNNAISIVGKSWESRDLAERLLQREGFFRQMGGGITLSGGEPLMQSGFCVDLLQRLHGRIHCALETSGFATGQVFERVASLCDFVYMDLKLADENAHIAYTGVSNEKILDNAKWLKHSEIAHVFRIPLIPDITDSVENLCALSRIVDEDAVELLEYNSLAPAKYASVGKQFSPLITKKKSRFSDLSVFKNAKMKM